MRELLKQLAIVVIGLGILSFAVAIPAILIHELTMFVLERV